MLHFAERVIDAARVGDLAARLGIAKGSVFQHFGSKDGLVFEVYKQGGSFVPAISGRAGGGSRTGVSLMCFAIGSCVRNICFTRIGFRIAFLCWAITVPIWAKAGD